MKVSGNLDIYSLLQVLSNTFEKCRNQMHSYSEGLLGKKFPVKSFRTFSRNFRKNRKWVRKFSRGIFPTHSLNCDVACHLSVLLCVCCQLVGGSCRLHYVVSLLKLWCELPVFLHLHCCNIQLTVYGVVSNVSHFISPVQTPLVCKSSLRSGVIG